MSGYLDEDVSDLPEDFGRMEWSTARQRFIIYLIVWGAIAAFLVLCGLAILLHQFYPNGV